MTAPITRVTGLITRVPALATGVTAAGVLFFRQGVRCAIRSRDIIVQAVVAEVVPSRFLGNLGQTAGETPA